MLTFGSLFAGIGGFDLGLERAGMECVWQCEKDPYALKVLEKHWPDVRRYDDITTLDAATLAPVDLICGGFPCQPFSVAGKRKGASDDRFLWPAMLKVVETVRPTWVLGENVPGLISLGLDGMLSDLEGLGYSVRAFVVPACAVDATHRRDRLWVIAHSDSIGFSWRSQGPRLEGAKEQLERLLPASSWGGAPRSGENRGGDGISRTMDRLKCLGNAVVPQVVEEFGRMIVAAHETYYGGTHD